MVKIDAKKLKSLFVKFFEQKAHKSIPNVSLIPHEDPTVLFTTAGMHPLVPFLLGQPHPLGKRLVNVQKCLRTDDIEYVGDTAHLTFFEMLGYWSLGDYFKKEAIEMSFEFLTNKKWLGLDKKKIFVTVFAGDKDAPADEESAKTWQSLGIPKNRIFYLPKKDNWWGPAGETGPCGPDTEMFYDTGKKPHGKDCKPGDSCGKFIEIGNDVFMEYNKIADGKFEKLKQKNVDFGMGLERTTAALENKDNVYDIEILKPIFDKIKNIADIDEPTEDEKRSIRIITDHMRAATFVLAENIEPSNKYHGYVLRRLIRRSIRHGRLIGIQKNFLEQVAEVVVKIYKDEYTHLQEKKNFVMGELREEELKFSKTLSEGLKKFNQIAVQKKFIDGKDAFLLFQSFGFPIETTKELAKENGVTVDEKGFEEEFRKHQELSRVGAEKKFKGGLADTSEKTIRLHTATHLLNEAIRRVLKRKDIVQKGSNITSERLRFDFNFERKLTEKEIKEIENLVNEQIRKGLKVERLDTTFGEAKKMGAQAEFEQKYGEKVSVYKIGNFSIEVCGGPHVKNTNELSKFKIVKEESVAAGIRRIKAILE